MVQASCQFCTKIHNNILIRRDAMRNYDRVNAPPPKDIKKKHAYIIGGGLAGLSAAISLVTDAHMPPANITIYDSLPILGGSMDAAGNSIAGYTSRGERELEARMECLWYICSKIPSIQTPGMTVLDETYYANVREPINSKFRLMHKQGQLYDYSGPLMSVHDTKRMAELLLTPEEELEDLSAEDWFSSDFTKSVFWYCWSTMLAFRPYHSLIEVRRYLSRFMMYTSCVTRLSNILHTEYNEYDSIIKPMHVWLCSLGVDFKTNTTVTDIEIAEHSGETVVTGLEIKDLDGERRIELNKNDFVFFTNGSLTQNAMMGNSNSVAPLNRDTENRGCFTLWEKLAAKDKKFGNPSAFLSNIDKTNFISFFPTIRGDRTFFDFIETKTGNAAGTGGAITIIDSSWKLAFVLYNKYFPNQPEDTNVFFAYGQCTDTPGDFIKKPMKECSGTELFIELLHHCGCNEEQIKRTLAHATVSTAMMPYVTSQFMPRKISDRPRVIPDGCVNLAFIGQFVELPLDVVFTVETSVRTALMAVWGLTGLQKPMIPVYEPTYDIRVIIDTLKASLGIEEISLSTLPLILSSAPSLTLLWNKLNDLPKPLI